MAEKAIAPPALVKFVREYFVLADRYDGNDRLAGEGAIAALTPAERGALAGFCEEWLAIPVPPKHSGNIRMAGLGRFRMSRMQLRGVRDALIAFDAQAKRKLPTR